jgi:hypothetical protein
MKTGEHFIFLLVLLFSSYAAQSQPKAESEIRKLEQAELHAVLKGDTVTLFQQLWAPEFIVNNPANIVVTRRQVAELIRAGKIDYERFERVVECVSIIDNTAIVMGHELVSPEGATDNAGKSLTRRYTNIWMKRGKLWKLVARQATIVPVQ